MKYSFGNTYIGFAIINDKEFLTIGLHMWPFKIHIIISNEITINFTLYKLKIGVTTGIV